LKFAVTQRSSGTSIIKVWPAGHRVGSRGCRKPGDAARDRRGERGARKIGVRLLKLRLLELALTGPAWRAKDVDLLFSFRMRRLGCGVGGLLLAKIARCLLCLLHGAGAFRDEILVARILLLREGECGFRLACLLRGLFDARLLLLELCIGVGDRCLRYLGLGLGLVDRGAIIAIIDARENRAGWTSSLSVTGTETSAPATCVLTATGRPSMKASSVVS
jgi:hypothetical protein